MSRPAKELIAVSHVGFIRNEAALKELTTIFSRIAFLALSVMLRPNAAHLFTPEFNKNLSTLVDLGILYEPDMEKSKATADNDVRNSILSLIPDANEIMKPFGVTVEEMFAARNNKEELKKIREKSRVSAEEHAARIPDLGRAMQTYKRMSVNTTRMQAIGVRNSENSDAYAIIPSGDSTLDDDDQRLTKHHVLKIAVVVPVPDEQTSWQQIFDYRNDTDAQGGFFELKEWMSDVARGVIAARASCLTCSASLSGSNVQRRCACAITRMQPQKSTRSTQINLCASCAFLWLNTRFTEDKQTLARDS